MALSDVVKTALDQITTIAKTETVVGEPIVAGGVTLIPVSKISIGFAAGGAGNEAKSGAGAATGGGVNIIPVAFISITQSRVQVHPISRLDAELGRLLSLAPDLIRKIGNLIRGGEEKPDEAPKPHE
jgi:uncharacterized spore protein YtfJ